MKVCTGNNLLKKINTVVAPPDFLAALFFYKAIASTVKMNNQYGRFTMANERNEILLHYTTMHIKRWSLLI